MKAIHLTAHPLRWYRISVLATVGVLLVGATSQVQAQSRTQAGQAATAFAEATADYVSMHRRLEQRVGSIDINTPVESINRQVLALAAAIRSERPSAREGDLFTPALGQDLRAQVAIALLDSGFSVADVRASQYIEGVDPNKVQLHVNDTFPWILGTQTFPCVILALPGLPPELQYRMVGSDLVLVDVHASLIVDILRNVLPDLTAAPNRMEAQ